MDDEDIISLPQSKKCWTCFRIKSVEQFSPYTKGKDGLYPMCQECEAKKKRSRQALNRPSERRKYAEYQMHALHLTKRDY